MATEKSTHDQPPTGSLAESGTDDANLTDDSDARTGGSDQPGRRTLFKSGSGNLSSDDISQEQTHTFPESGKRNYRPIMIAILPSEANSQETTGRMVRERPPEWAQEKVIRFLIQRCGNRMTAEDLAQNALATIVEREGERGWQIADQGLLFRVALNELNNYRRKTKGRSRYVVEWNEEQLSLIPADHEYFTDVIMDIRLALSHLAEEDRRLIIDFWEGYSYEEMAEHRKISLSCLKMRMRRAKERFAAEMQGYGGLFTNSSVDA